ncbi:citrate synthase/methylcitrate synthase [Ochrobactrum sp. CM-21-5]|nr:citrate synthase/methylcitrate synthase [Ochrobactrum sp. CM-21-5]MBC2886680.1 citrate synthase/methylcitrate synthase [Ochrobactrum sp. CM-21-5]
MRNGLEDVIATETVLSDVDGVAGRLVIRGRSLEYLVPKSRVEDCIKLLWAGFFDDFPTGQVLQHALGEARVQVFPHVEAIDGGLLELGPVEALRALMARIPDGNDFTSALQLMAAPAVFTAALLRMRRGRQAIRPDSGIPHSADILRMLNASMPEDSAVAGLDSYLVAISEHGLNASTFAARVVASTQAGLTSSLLAALGALKGPLHGGDPGPVLDMLDSIGNEENVERWLNAAMMDGERLTGFGHRIYRVRDPRADILKAAVKRMQVVQQEPDNERLKLAEAVEKAAIAILKNRTPEGPLHTNVEFYTALLLERLGFPRDAFTCVFAMGRAMGWIAHSREQAMENRVIRPQSHYTGPKAAPLA